MVDMFHSHHGGFIPMLGLLEFPLYYVIPIMGIFKFPLCAFHSHAGFIGISIVYIFHSHCVYFIPMLGLLEFPLCTFNSHHGIT